MFSLTPVNCEERSVHVMSINPKQMIGCITFLASVDVLFLCIPPNVPYNCLQRLGLLPYLVKILSYRSTLSCPGVDVFNSIDSGL